jgi:hypothetical protein
MPAIALRCPVRHFSAHCLVQRQPGVARPRVRQKPPAGETGGWQRAGEAGPPNGRGLKSSVECEISTFSGCIVVQPYHSKPPTPHGINPPRLVFAVAVNAGGREFHAVSSRE